MDSIINEVLVAVGGVIGAGILAGIDVLRRRSAAWLARQAVIGAVERAAGLALEAERTGSTGAMAARMAENYVKMAVPDALERVKAGQHLNLMIQGAVGVLRAGKPR